ncbi:hypothetical protein D3P09_00645 [Paenibacillus pinisoli]|uniref:Uncharacterized protein n=1 Tax=Paenibacillus pinisoli TaxID=1276110 RepID=A0A3A6PHN7_9BACL|nr:hypothetical protein [Paenibacillus pinisoli]RJX40565.1 hypothetical protein D3P09_00645 [Paenibacillus pinisoli]
MKNHSITKICLAVLIALSSTSFCHQALAAQRVESQTSSPTASIPMLASLSQISANQLQLSYDQPVDQAKGTDPRNYWIQATSEQNPVNIATLGMNDSVNRNNSLTPDRVKIQASGTDGKSFLLTFNQNIAKGKSFKLIICYVTRPGAPPYSGDNGSATFVGQ